MIRLYLDKCVYSNIKSGKYNNLNDFLIQHQNKIIVPYSTATMLDLINYDHFNESAKEKLLDEFPYILSVSKDHLLRFNEESNRVECYKEEIQEYLKLENIDYKPHEEFLKDSCNDSDVMSFWKSIAGVQQDKETNIYDFLHQEESKEKSHLFDVFTKEGVKDKNAFKLFRMSIPQKLQIDVQDKSNWVIQIENKLEKEGLNLNSVIDELLNLLGLKHNAMNRYKALYVALDIFCGKNGENKNSLDSILRDAEHSFYATHCDYFVSSDKGIIKKTGQISKRFNSMLHLYYLPSKETSIEEAVNKLTNDILANITERNNPFFLADVSKLNLKKIEDEHYKGFARINNFLNFFDTIYSDIIPEESSFRYILRKDMGIARHFLFMTELDNVFEELKHLSFEKYEDLEQLRKEFYQKKVNGFVFWELEGVKFLVCVDPVEKHAIIPQLIIFKNNNIA